MAKGIKLDGVGFNADHVRSFDTEKEMVDHFLETHDHIWTGLSKAERVKKFKLLYKLCKNPVS
jgi:hypothetical protein